MQPRFPVAQSGQFVNLCGVAAAGKDMLAAPFLAAGYVRHNYGDLIKAFYDPFTTGREDLAELLSRLAASYSPNPDAALPMDVTQVTREIFGPYAAGGHRVSSYTEDRSEKPYVRAILERGGELIYGSVQTQYNTMLAELIETGGRIINTRLCAVAEAGSAKARGGEVIQVIRSGHAPASEWDAQMVLDLEDGGWIDSAVYNDAPTAEGWAEFAEQWAQAYLTRKGMHARLSSAAAA